MKGIGAGIASSFGEMEVGFWFLFLAFSLWQAQIRQIEPLYSFHFGVPCSGRVAHLFVHGKLRGLFALIA